MQTASLYGGSAQDELAATTRWDQARAAKIRLLEVRGTLPDEVTCPETNITFKPEMGTVPKALTLHLRRMWHSTGRAGYCEGQRQDGSDGRLCYAGLCSKRDEAVSPTAVGSLRPMIRLTLGSTMQRLRNGKQQGRLILEITGRDLRFQWCMKLAPHDVEGHHHSRIGGRCSIHASFSFMRNY